MDAVPAKPVNFLQLFQHDRHRIAQIGVVVGVQKPAVRGNESQLAASIFQAVVDQTVAGLTQGRELKGKLVFLGGPLHFLMGLRERFVDTPAAAVA